MTANEGSGQSSENPVRRISIPLLALDTAAAPPHSVRVIIPHDQLEPDTLRALIEEFVSRDGSIQGHAEASMERKIETVMAQLKSGAAAIVYDPDDDTCSIAERRSLGREHRGTNP